MIGKWFESYDEAWNHFLTRETPLEDFWSALPERDDSTVAVWLIQPPQRVKDAVRDVLARLRELERVAVVPEHFLHISIRVVAHDPAPSSVRDLVDGAREGVQGSTVRVISRRQRPALPGPDCPLDLPAPMGGRRNSTTRESMTTAS